MSRWLRIRQPVDRCVAAVLTILLAPVLAVIAVLVRRSDGGPGLITVPRVGRHGTEFGMWKVRSMSVALTDGRAGGRGLTRGDDNRITPIGRRLRRLHLDEIPQLFNVVRGEMSLFGPRPEAPQFVDRNRSEWIDVLAMAPGMAGPTQLLVGEWELSRITRIGEDDYLDNVVPVKVAIDAWYVRRASPVVDVLVTISLVRSWVGRPPLPSLVRRITATVEPAREPVEWSRSVR